MKKDNKKIEQITESIKTTSLSEYHKCPVCGHKNKTKQRDWSKYTQMYLDGQYKITMQDYIDEYYYCPECGFLYSNSYIDKNMPEDYFSDMIKKTVYSKEYQDIRYSDADEIYKKILLMDLISKCPEGMFVNINQIWLNYYESIDNQEKQLHYLQKRIKEIPKGVFCSDNIRYGESVIVFPESYRYRALYIGENELLTDLNRRAGNFDKAQQLAEHALNTYEFTNIKSPRKTFYECQLKLIKERNKRHI